MSIATEFSAAVAACTDDLPGPELLPERLARAAARVLPVDGAGISLFFAEDRRLPVGASDPVAAQAERLQFTAGEGPCLTAHAQRLPVVVDEAALRSRWPAFADTFLGTTPFRSAASVALPGALRDIGALDLYVVAPDGVGRLGLLDVLTVAGEIAEAFAGHARRPSRSGSVPAWLDAPAAQRRALVWQAMGFLVAGLGIPAEQALSVLRAQAFSAGCDVDELAGRVVEGRIPLERFTLSDDPSR
ncbi:ANTAR domain-containing protein [Blastococcus sp. SYSU D00820]